jgi:hypothetical protein
MPIAEALLQYLYRRISDAKMHFLASAPLLLAVPLVSAAVVTIAACPKPSSKAVYFLDNNPSGAGIYALSIAEDGTVSDPVRTSTGGVGLYGLQASTTGGAAAAAGQGRVPFTY